MHTKSMVSLLSPSQLSSINFDLSASIPLYVQIYLGLRDSILNGRIPTGTRLPSTRALADLWKISRSTVLLAFQHLTEEGYLDAHTGSGTFVSSKLPDYKFNVIGDEKKDLPSPSSVEYKVRLAHRGEKIFQHYLSRRKLVDQPHYFRPGIPANDSFPTLLWKKLSSRIWAKVEPEKLLYIDSMGYTPLRDAISKYLSASRGITCSAENVIIVHSTQSALTLASQVLINPGDTVAIEDPGYIRAQASLTAVGARLEPIQVDKEGISISDLVSLKKIPRLVYTTPSHQYPLGMPMSLSRRLALIEWATHNNSLILEDDYISEFRYTGRPYPALQNLDTAGCVIYMGTFSKIFSPALRLGYLVVPDSLVEPFKAVRSLVDRSPSFIDQAVLTEFINEGYFARHVRKMRKIYFERQETLKAAIKENVADFIEIQESEAGLHLIGWLPKDVNDKEVTLHLAKNCIIAPALSYYCIKPYNRGALILGFAGWSPEEIKRAVSKLTESLQSFKRF